MQNSKLIADTIMNNTDLSPIYFGTKIQQVIVSTSADTDNSIGIPYRLHLLPMMHLSRQFACKFHTLVGKIMHRHHLIGTTVGAVTII